MIEEKYKCSPMRFGRHFCWENAFSENDAKLIFLEETRRRDLT